jgi:hypothetical protein
MSATEQAERAHLEEIKEKLALAIRRGDDAVKQFSDELRQKKQYIHEHQSSMDDADMVAADQSINRMAFTGEAAVARKRKLLKLSQSPYSQRYALLGALLFLPIIANVYVITISYDFGYTSVITGAMLLATVGLLAWDWHRLRVVLNQPALPAPAAALSESRLWELIGLVLFLFTAGYRAFIDAYNVLLWFGGCVGVGAVGLAIFWWGQRRPSQAATAEVAD